MTEKLGGFAVLGILLWALTSSPALARSCGQSWAPLLSVVCEVEEDTASKFKMVVSGSDSGEIGAGGLFVYSDNWEMSHSWSFLSAHLEDDVVTFSGTLKHKVAPHLEAVGPEFSYAGTLTYDTPSYKKLESKQHGIHVDNFQAFGLVTSDSPGNLGDTISTWKVTVIATHAPEPETWSMFFMGFGAIAWRIWHRNRTQGNCI